MKLSELLGLVGQLPAGGAVLLPRDALLEALAGVQATAEPPQPELLTVAEVATHFHRSASTVRAWCERGLLPGAVKVRGRSWHVPRAALAAFLEAQRTDAEVLSGESLGDWRSASKNPSRRRAGPRVT